jgi:hypothetical protein
MRSVTPDHMKMTTNVHGVRDVKLKTLPGLLDEKLQMLATIPFTATVLM